MNHLKNLLKIILKYFIDTYNLITYLLIFIIVYFASNAYFRGIPLREFHSIFVNSYIMKINDFLCFLLFLSMYYEHSITGISFH